MKRPGPSKKAVPLKDRMLAAYMRGPDHPSKLRFERYFARSLFNRNVLTRLPSGYLLEVDPGEWVGKTIILSGTYEPSTLGLITRIMTEMSGTFVDIGGNIGLHSVSAAGVVQTDSVVVFEPMVANHQRLVRNFEINGFTEKLISFLVPLSDEGRFVTLIQRRPGNAGTFGIEEQSGKLFRMFALSLKEVIADIEEIEKISCIKIDVEGHELHIISGIDFTGRLRPKNIIVEWMNGNDEEIFVTLAELGYAMFDVTGKKVFGWNVALPENNAWFVDVQA